MHITLIDTDNNWAWGSRILSAVLKRRGHHVRIVCMANRHGIVLRAGDARSRTTGRRFHDIGGQLLFGGIRAGETSSAAHSGAGQVKVWGGIHATLNPEECARFADVVCMGEGEGMIADLVEST